MTTGPHYYKKCGVIMLASGLLGLFVLYGLLLYNPTEDTILDFERDLALRMNSSLLHDGVWDWTVIIASSRFYLLSIFVIAIFSSMVWGWLRRSRDLGRMFGYAAWALIWALLAQEIGDEISDVIKRDPPRLVIPNLIDLRIEYSVTLETPSETGVPDENVLGIMCLALLLSIRARSAGLALFPLLLLHCIGQMSIGHRWLLDMTGAALFGAAFAGAGLFGLAWPLGKLERAAEDTFLRHLWKWIPLATVPSDEADSLRISKIQPARAKLLLDRKLRADIYWEEVIHREVLPLLNATPDSAQILKQPEGELGERWRGSRYVRFVKLASGEVFVVKLVRSVFGFARRSGRIQRAIRNAKCNLALERLGLPVPRLFWISEGTSLSGLVRHIILVEEFLRGRTLDPENESDVVESSSLLAQLHQTKSTGWGPLAITTTNTPANYLWNELRLRTLYMINRISGDYGPKWPDGLSARIWDLFRKEYESLIADGPIQFRLIHGDVGVRNLMRTENRVALIDFMTVRFDMPGAEIIRAVNSLTKRDSAMRRKAWVTYFNGAGPERWNEFKRSANFDLARFALRELAHDRALGLRPNSPSLEPEQIYLWLADILSLPSDVWGAAPTQTDWDRIASLLFDPIKVPSA